MNNSTKIVLLGLLLLLLVAPFAVFAPLVLIIFIAVVSLMGWTLMQTLITGKSSGGNAANATSDSQK